MLEGDAGKGGPVLGREVRYIRASCLEATGRTGGGRRIEPERAPERTHPREQRQTVLVTVVAFAGHSRPSSTVRRSLSLGAPNGGPNSAVVNRQDTPGEYAFHVNIAHSGRKRSPPEEPTPKKMRC